VNVVGYLVTFFLNNPGFTTSLYRDQSISFRGCVGRASSSITNLSLEVERELKGAILRYFPNMDLDVVCKLNHMEGDRYRVELTISTGGEVLLPRSLFEVGVEGEVKFIPKGEA
jgi:hypothetical protein